MDTTNRLTTSCRHCRFYTPQGRRGGSCSQLGVTVSSTWRSCSLAVPPFAPSWETPFPAIALSHRLSPEAIELAPMEVVSIPTLECVIR